MPLHPRFTAADLLAPIGKLVYLRLQRRGGKSCGGVDASEANGSEWVAFEGTVTDVDAAGRVRVEPVAGEGFIWGSAASFPLAADIDAALLRPEANARLAGLGLKKSEPGDRGEREDGTVFGRPIEGDQGQH